MADHVIAYRRGSALQLVTLLAYKYTDDARVALKATRSRARTHGDPRHYDLYALTPVGVGVPLLGDVVVGDRRPDGRVQVHTPTALTYWVSAETALEQRRDRARAAHADPDRYRLYRLILDRDLDPEEGL